MPVIFLVTVNDHAYLETIVFFRRFHYSTKYMIHDDDSVLPSH